MRRAADIVGTKVLDVSVGEIVGYVQDLVFDREGQLQGLLLDKKHWFAKTPFLPIETIHSIGEDMVTISQSPDYQPELIQDGWIRLVNGNGHLKGLPVVTSNGKQLGVLEDVYFQEEMGTIIGYELSDGFFSDLMEGRRMIKRPHKLFIGKDAIIHQEEESGPI